MINLLIRLCQLVSTKEKKGSVLLMLMMLIGTMIETLGVGLIVPILALLSDPSFAGKHPIVSGLLGELSPSHWMLFIFPDLHLPLQDHSVQVFAGAMVVLIAFFTFKALFLTLLVWQQTKLLFRVQVSISQELFAGYLRQPYSFHLQRNSAQLIRNATTESGQIAGAFLSAANLITECLVVAGISLLLMWYQPVGALSVVLLFGFSGWCFYRMIKGRSSVWGETRMVHEGEKLQHLQQGLGGVKEVKLLGREEDFISQYNHHTAGSAKMDERQNVAIALPRLFLEWAAVVGLSLLVFVLTLQGHSSAYIITTMGLFAVAAFRVMPSVNRIVSSLQILRFSAPSLILIDDEIQVLNKNNGASDSESQLGLLNECSDWHLLHVKQATFSFSGSAQPTLKKIDLTINRGAVVGFIGGSGAGKSTLIDLMMGLFHPEDGEVLLDGTNIKANLRAWQNQFGYVPQSIFLIDDTLRRNVAFGIPDAKINDEKVKAAIKAAHLVEFVSELPLGLETMVGERGVRISGGQRQRIGIARALYHQPSVLVLDEATSALDIATEKQVMESVKELRGSKTILIVAHRMSTVEDCDIIYRLDSGQIINSGTYPEVTS